MAKEQWLTELENLLTKLGTMEFTLDHCREDNIFHVLGIETNEVKICRFLAFLLKPGMLENMGCRPLQLFLKTIGVEDDGGEEISNAEILLEEKIDKNRRVDLVIRIGRRVYPFEVKIWAGDQYAQLHDYYFYYKKNNWEIKKIYYLTPSGWPPSAESLGDLALENVQCISFSNQILSWLEALLQREELQPEHRKLVADFREVAITMSSSTCNTENILKVLNIDQQGIKENHTLEGLLHLLSVKQEDIWHPIRDRYLWDALVLNGEPLHGHKNYELVPVKEKEIGNEIFKILYKDEPIAWICVLNNLYIVAKKKTSDIDQPTTDDKGEDCWWAYLKPVGYPNNKMPFQLKVVNSDICSCPKIELNRYLDELTE